MTTAPLSCPAGHTLGRGNVLVGWLPCRCPGARNGGHRTWTCRQCEKAGHHDDATILDGQHTLEPPSQPLTLRGSATGDTSDT